jgi:hypothetical protein
MGITESRKQNNYVKCKENKNRGNNQINRWQGRQDDSKNSGPKDVRKLGLPAIQSITKWNVEGITRKTCQDCRSKRKLRLINSLWNSQSQQKWRGNQEKEGNSKNSSITTQTMETNRTS